MTTPLLRAAAFPLHGHREMEIVTYLIDGALEHHDDLGNTGIIRPGEIQRMSAGTGVRHSEFNHSKKDPVHLVQLWITPAVNRPGTFVGAERFFARRSLGQAAADCRACKQERRSSVASAVQIHQDASIYTSLLAPGQSATHQLAEGRRAYIFVIGGKLQLNGKTLEPGDQARVTRRTRIATLRGAGSRRELRRISCFSICLKRIF